MNSHFDNKKIMEKKQLIYLKDFFSIEFVRFSKPLRRFVDIFNGYSYCHKNQSGINVTITKLNHDYILEIIAIKRQDKNYFGTAKIIDVKCELDLCCLEFLQLHQYRKFKNIFPCKICNCVDAK